MAPTPERPLISDELLELFASGVDMYVATRDRALNPESVLGMGVRVHDDRRTVTVYVPTALAAITLTNLEDNGQIATTLSRPRDQRTVQLKGHCTGVRASSEADRQLQEVFRAAMVTALAAVGVPRALTRAITWWPSTALDFQVQAVFEQTPGPAAGEPLH